MSKTATATKPIPKARGSALGPKSKVKSAQSKASNAKLSNTKLKSQGTKKAPLTGQKRKAPLVDKNKRPTKLAKTTPSPVKLNVKKAAPPKKVTKSVPTKGVKKASPIKKPLDVPAGVKKEPGEVGPGEISENDKVAESEETPKKKPSRKPKERMTGNKEREIKKQHYDGRMSIPRAVANNLIADVASEVAMEQRQYGGLRIKTPPMFTKGAKLLLRKTIEGSLINQFYICSQLGNFYHKKTLTGGALSLIYSLFGNTDINPQKYMQRNKKSSFGNRASVIKREPGTRPRPRVKKESTIPVEKEGGVKKEVNVKKEAGVKKRVGVKKGAGVKKRVTFKKEKEDAIEENKEENKEEYKKEKKEEEKIEDINTKPLATQDTDNMDWTQSGDAVSALDGNQITEGEEEEEEEEEEGNKDAINKQGKQEEEEEEEEVVETKVQLAEDTVKEVHPVEQKTQETSLEMGEESDQDSDESSSDNTEQQPTSQDPFVMNYEKLIGL
jgi:hypothetical protein